MSSINKHGLSRNIPADIKRNVRKRCGYGCVICGFAWYDYEHFYPEFKDALEHSEDEITLLCMQCNQKRNRGVLSLEKVIKANEKPKCLSDKFAHEYFDFSDNDLDISIAGTHYKNCKNLIQINEKPILSIQKDENGILISGVFYNSLGKKSLKIINNKWDVYIDNWDIECIGNVILIREKLREISLKIKILPPSKLIIEKLNMRYKDIHLKGNENKLEISQDNGKTWNRFYNISMINCKCGIYIEHKIRKIILSSILSKYILEKKLPSLPTNYLNSSKYKTKIKIYNKKIKN
ncbi:MAG: hypothetical protein ACNI25_12015 [Halarcobacter sp.]